MVGCVCGVLVAPVEPAEEFEFELLTGVVVVVAGVVVVVACCSARLTCAGVKTCAFCEMWVTTECDVLKVVFEDCEILPALLLEKLPVAWLAIEPATGPFPEEALLLPS